MARSGNRLQWSPHLVRVSLAGHSLLGIVLGALVYHVCLTGTLAVLTAEFQRWEQPQAPRVASVAPEGFAAAAEMALTRPNVRGKSIVLLGPTPDKPRLELRLPESGQANMFLRSDGRESDQVHAPWTSFVVKLHDELHLPAPWGRIVIGLSGVVLLALIFTGLCAHSRIFRDAFHLRLGSATRLSESDLHNRMSVWSLPFQLVVSATGAILALGGLVGPLLILIAYAGNAEQGLAEFVGPQPAVERMEPAPLPDIAALIRRIEAAHDPAKVSYVEINQAGTAGQVLHIDTNTPRDLASGESYRFDGRGTALGSAGYGTGSAGKQMLAALAPLHYGSFGGIWVKASYALLGAMLCAVCATGINIWLIRRHQRGQPSEFWERVWIVVVWGQPLALALSAVASLLTMDPLQAYILATVLSIGLLTLRLRASDLRRLLRMFTGIVVALAVVSNLVTRGLPTSDELALVFNLLFGLGSIFLIWQSGVPRKSL
jgi:uncharacterized iron-regulated membrane protein